jgi:hypothetical protein
MSAFAGNAATKDGHRFLIDLPADKVNRGGYQYEGPKADEHDNGGNPAHDFAPVIKCQFKRHKMDAMLIEQNIV